MPHAVASAELDHDLRRGLRVLGRIEPADKAAIGAAVLSRFVDHDSWTELRFAVVA